MAIKAEQLKACDESIRHWEKNLKLLLKWQQDKTEVRRLFNVLEPLKLNGNTDYESDWLVFDGAECALCKINFGTSDITCPRCPLIKVDTCCNLDGSIWKKFKRSKDIEEYIKYAKQMIAAIKKAKKYV